MSKWIRPASRAGIKDPRQSTFITNLADIEAHGGSRPKPLSSKSAVLSLEDLDEVTRPGDEPLGQAPAVDHGVATRMTAFFAPKGGVGSTVLACNMAGVLAGLGQRVVLCDLDLQLGAVPTSLNLKPERSIAELVVEAERVGTGPLESGLDRHHSGLTVVAQGDRIEELSEVTAERLPRLFDALGQQFEHVIVDGLRDFSDHAVSAMDLAHQVVLVATQDVPSVRAAARALRIFRRLGYEPGRIKVVLNRYHKRAPVSLEAIHNALGQPVDAVVRNDFPLVESALNHGVMVSELKATAGLTRDVAALARLLAGLPTGERSGGGLLSRLFGRG